VDVKSFNAKSAEGSAEFRREMQREKYKERNTKREIQREKYKERNMESVMSVA
jgi:hypothetical protein